MIGKKGKKYLPRIAGKAAINGSFATKMEQIEHDHCKEQILEM